LGQSVDNETDMINDSSSAIDEMTANISSVTKSINTNAITFNELND
jgi:hypothetical protein